MGQLAEGLAALAEASVLTQRTGEQWYEAELYRLRGELLLTQESNEHKSETPDPKAQIPEPNAKSEAEACFLKAIDIAQRQQAKSLELRAVMSLSRLWQQQGKIAEAHQMLSDIYTWFTEGFDTTDLQEAQALLAEVGETL